MRPLVGQSSHQSHSEPGLRTPGLVPIEPEETRSLSLRAGESAGSRRLGSAASISDLRRLAARNLPRMVFDYIDGAAGEETTARRNRSDFDKYVLRPEILVDVSERSLGTTLFNQHVAKPLVIGPTGLNGAYWPFGDLCIARAAQAEGIPFVMSTAATVKLDAIDTAAGPLRWFQLYMLNDRELARTFLDRVSAHGFSVLQLTVDTAVGGRRNRDIRNGFTLPFRWTFRNLVDTAMHPRWAMQMLRAGSPTLELFADVLGNVPRGRTIGEVMQQQISSSVSWGDLDWLRHHWKGPLVLKGVSSGEHVRRAQDAGIDGVVVSNHGGRQLEGAPSTVEMLPPIVDAAAGRTTVLIDSGFRTGTDVAKALALGADGVQLGRSTLYGLAAAGERGVRHALRILTEELDRALALTGATNLRELRGRIDRC
jgi:(S)-mandelate dehydrogenase